ncbi:hypothetical protein GUJ93_ZPchr0015g6770 [Zizania palustris]|uniref:Uncharacterized protein n=1 Tax=Zizania palustris TaxID=103762 RepID=A0A8J5VST7_ZIZPA|nr:hypothetical protein GUJ93_ZPchr0015g6770 [Zizania palustris]
MTPRRAYARATTRLPARAPITARLPAHELAPPCARHPAWARVRAPLSRNLSARHAPPHASLRKQKDSFVRDRSLVLRELQHAAEHQLCAGQQAILERESLPRVETSIHALVTNIARYDTEDIKVAIPMVTLMNSSGGGSLSKRRMDAIGYYPASPKKKFVATPHPRKSVKP